MGSIPTPSAILERTIMIKLLVLSLCLLTGCARQYNATPKMFDAYKVCHFHPLKVDTLVCSPTMSYSEAVKSVASMPKPLHYWIDWGN